VKSVLVASNRKKKVGINKNPVLVGEKISDKNKKVNGIGYENC